MTDLSDEELMLMFKYGRVEAFDLLFEKYRKPLLNFVFRMVGSRAAAEDLFQDVFIQVVRAAERYQATARFTTWLYKIATNRCLNHLTSAGYRFARGVIPLHTGTSAVDDLSSNDPLPDQVAAGHELADILHEVVLDLPPAQRAAFVLRDIHEKQYREIAEILDEPMGTVKTHLHRAREKVRRQMRRYLQ